MEICLPGKQTKLVLPWAELHLEGTDGRLETRDEWRRAVQDSTSSVRSGRKWVAYD